MFKMHVRFVLVVDCALENVDDSFGPVSHHFAGPLAGRAVGDMASLGALIVGMHIILRTDKESSF